MKRILVQEYKVQAKCPCRLRLQQYKDEGKDLHGVMIVGKPCADEDCDGRHICAVITKRLKELGGIPHVINGEQVH